MATNDCEGCRNCCPKIGPLLHLADWGASLPPTQELLPADCGGSEGSGNGVIDASLLGSSGVAGLDNAKALISQVQAATVWSVPGAAPGSPAVDIATGNLYCKLPIVFSGSYAPPSRYTYNALAAKQAIQYGAGVAGLYNQVITVCGEDDSTVNLIKGEGSSFLFTDKNGSGYYLPPACSANSLQRISGGWIEAQPDGLRLFYEEVTGDDGGTYGRLSTLTNRGNQVWTLTYDGNGALTTITDPLSRTTTFDYSPDLETVTDHLDRETSFTITDGKLVTLIQPDTKSIELAYDDELVIGYKDLAGYRTTFAYDSKNRVKTIQTPLDEITTFAYVNDTTLEMTDARSKLTTITFDGDRNVTRVARPLNDETEYVWDDGRLAAIVDPNDQRTSFVYETGMSNRTRPVKEIHFADGGVFEYVYDTTNNRLQAVVDQNHNRTTLHWDAGQRVAIEDARGERTTYAYNGRGQIDKVTNPLGIVTTYTYYDAGDRNLRSIENGAGEKTTFVYDAYERVQQVNAPLGLTTSYAYDQMNRRTDIYDPLNHRTQYVYEDDGLLKAIINPLNESTTTVYDENRRIKATVNAEGHRTTFAYDEVGNLRSVQNPLGHVTTYVYDDADRRLSEEDPEHRITTFGYDNGGNLTTVTRQLPTSPYLAVTTYEYDEVNRLRAIANPLNQRTTYGYDEVGNQRTLRDPLNSVWETTYDELNRREMEKDPRNNVTTYSYDDAGRLVRVENAAGEVTTTGYDDANRVRTVENAEGHVTTTTYDAAGRPWYVTDPLGLITTNVYDASLLRAVENPEGHRTTYAYDDANRQTSVTNAENQTTFFGYYPDGQLKFTADPLDHRTTYSYDAANQQTEVRNGANDVYVTTYTSTGKVLATVDGEQKRTTHAYDSLDRLWSTQRPDGKRTTYVYDAADRLGTTISPMGFPTYRTYYDNGQIKTITDAEDRVTTNVYWPDGLLKQQIDAKGGIASYTYDAANRRKTAVAPDGLTTTYAYYPDGQLESLTAPGGRITTYTYDAANRLTHVKNPNSEESESIYWPDGQLRANVTPLGHRTTYVYDKANRLTEQIDAENRVTTTTYDVAGRAIEVRDARGYRTTTTYDAADRPTEMQNARNYRTTWTYDHNGRVTREVDPLNQVTTYTYYPTGEVESKRDARGIAVTFAYDDNRRKTEHVYSNGLRFTFTHDDVDNRLTMVDPTGTTAYGYDDLNRVESVTNAAGHVVTYGYDPASRRTGMTGAGGSFVYHYDDTGRMDYLIDSFGDRTTFSYDPADRLLVKRLANGTRTSHTYDPDGRLTQLYQFRSDNVVLDGLSYDYNNVGVRRKLTDSSGAVVTWTYDEIYQLTGELRDGPSIIDWETLTLGEWENLSLADWELMELNPRDGDFQIGYVYDPVGNRLVHSVGGDLTTYVYDAANQLSTSQDSSGTTTYAYDGAGNLLGIAAPGGVTTYTWSADNRQTKAELPNSYVVTNTYRADGLRHQKTDAAGATRFVYDGKAYLAETDGSNVIRAVYANEPAEFGGLVSQRRLSGLLWLPSYYHFDAVGSTRGLTGALQGFVAFYPATAFGEQLTDSAQVNPFRFVGQLGYYYDEEAGQNQVRERAYNPKLGGWLNADPAQHDLNPFRYVFNSPLAGVDPSGLREADDRETTDTKKLVDVDNRIELIVNRIILKRFNEAQKDALDPEEFVYLVYDDLGSDAPKTGVSTPIGSVSQLGRAGVLIEADLNAIGKSAIVQVPFTSSRYRENRLGLLWADPLLGVPWFFSADTAQHGLAPTIRVSGTLMGVDKWEHFFQQGYWTWDSVRTGALTSRDEVMAFQLFMEGGYEEGTIRHNPRDTAKYLPIAQSYNAAFSARGYFGLYSTGVISMADISANLEGQRFYAMLHAAYKRGKALTFRVKSFNTRMFNESRINRNQYGPGDVNQKRVQINDMP